MGTSQGLSPGSEASHLSLLPAQLQDGRTYKLIICQWISRREIIWVLQILQKVPLQSCISFSCVQQGLGPCAPVEVLEEKEGLRVKSGKLRH